MSALQDQTDDLLREARVRERILAVVRASAGIYTERVAAAACCSLFEAIRLLEELFDENLVEEAELHDGSAWFPIPWCHICGCTELHACNGGCSWTIEPGTQQGFGDGAGVCSGCQP